MQRNPLAAGLSASLLTTLVTGLVVVSVLFLRLWVVADERSRLYYAESQRSQQLREASTQARARPSGPMSKHEQPELPRSWPTAACTACA